MDELDTPSILAVGAKLANLQRARVTGEIDPRVGWVEVDSGVKAFELLRVLKFDLVAVGPGVVDMSFQTFAMRLNAARPWQKWALVADEGLDESGEMMARALGAIAVLDGPEAWKGVVDVARLVCRRNPATRVPNLSIRPAAV